ncbi:MAG: SRPBCC family protein [bacterium]
MTFIRNVILGGLALLAIAYLAGFVLPDECHVQREITIKAPRHEVFALIGDFHQWEKWSPWAELDPDTAYIITGAGLGHSMSWKSDNPNVGQGHQKIITYDPPRMIETELDFGDMGRAQSAMILTGEDGAVRVVWTLDTNMRAGVPLFQKPMATYMGFFMDKWVGGDYEKGLAKLKKTAESK